MKLLLTRPLEDSQKLKDKIEKISDYQCVISPLLEIEILKKDIPLNYQDAYFLLTSVNSVRALNNNISDKDINVITVGDTSLTEAKKMGFQNSYSATKNTDLYGEKAIINYITQNIPQNKKLIHISANITKGGLKQELKNLGYNYEALVLYKSKKKDLSQEVTDIIAKSPNEIDFSFFSARTAAIFTSQVIEKNFHHMLENSKVFCFSSNVLAGLNGIKFSKTLIPENVSMNSFLNMLQNGK